jgi:dipeptidase E
MSRSAPVTPSRRNILKYLLTLAGVRNPSIHNALLDLLGKPIAECSAMCIPTAMYGHPYVPPAYTWQFTSGREPENPMVDRGWKSMGVQPSHYDA